MAKISWLTKDQRLHVDSCNTFNQYIAHNVQKLNVKADKIAQDFDFGVKDRKAWELAKSNSRMAIQKYKMKVIANPFHPRGEHPSREVKDTFYFIQPYHRGNEWEEISYKDYDMYTSSSRSNSHETLICTFDPKTFQFNSY